MLDIGNFIYSRKKANKSLSKMGKKATQNRYDLFSYQLFENIKQKATFAARFLRA